jgi:hypothetical protein
MTPLVYKNLKFLYQWNLVRSGEIWEKMNLNITFKFEFEVSLQVEFGKIWRNLNLNLTFKFL